MIKDKALEELFLTQRPHFDDHDAFMDVLTHRLDAVEYLKQHQDTTIRRYKLVMIVAFIVGILSGAVTMAFILSTPFDVPLFNFHVHTGFLFWLSEISRPIVAAALTLLMTVGIISLISNIQDINNIMNMNKKTIITMMLAIVTMTGQAQTKNYTIQGNLSEVTSASLIHRSSMPRTFQLHFTELTPSLIPSSLPPTAPSSPAISMEMN